MTFGKILGDGHLCVFKCPEKHQAHVGVDFAHLGGIVNPIPQYIVYISTSKVCNTDTRTRVFQDQKMFARRGVEDLKDLVRLDAARHMPATVLRAASSNWLTSTRPVRSLM